MLRALPLNERGGILADSSLGWSSREGCRDLSLSYALGIGIYGLGPIACSAPPLATYHSQKSYLHYIIRNEFNL